MRILVPGALRRDGGGPPPAILAFTTNPAVDTVTRFDLQRRPIEFRTGPAGTTGFCEGVPVDLPEALARIRSTVQLRVVLDGHDLFPTDRGSLDIRPRPRSPVASIPFQAPGDPSGQPFTMMADCAGAGCGAVGGGAGGCAAAGGGAGGCGAAGCAGAGCAAVGCAAVGCAAAGKGGGGCGAAGCGAVACGAVACAAAGCAAAGCGAAGCAAAGCAAVACAAATGFCGAAACALDAGCAANAGWPP